MHLCRDPAFDIESTNWDAFSRWEVRPHRRAGYLGNVDWDRNLEPVVSSDDEDDEDEDNDNDDDEAEDDAKTLPPPRVSGEVSGQIYNGQVIRDDTNNMINHVVYHYFHAADRSEVYQMPPELTEEEELADALILLVELPPPPGPPLMQPSRTPSARPRREARAKPWDVWPGAATGWPAGAPPVLGWAPGTPTLPPGPPPPPIANWPWSHGPFIDLSGDDGDE
jgi:hypothetical protein